MFDFTPDFDETLNAKNVSTATNETTSNRRMQSLGQDELFGLISKDSATLNLIRIRIMPPKRMGNSMFQTRRHDCSATSNIPRDTHT